MIGFGIATVLPNTHNAGLLPVSAMILAMGLFYGGIGPIVADPETDDVAPA
jgi:uncharacterized protein